MADNVDLRTDAQTDPEYQNRGLDTKSEENAEISISLLDIDTAIISYITDVIRPYIIQYGQRVEVPVVIATPERWQTIQELGYLRDKTSKITQLPLIAWKRTNMRKGSLHNPVNKYYERNFDSVGWNKRNRYDRFAVVNGIKPSERYVSVMYPDYYDMSYDIFIWTDKVTHMSQIIEQLSFETENYWGDENKYKFRVSVDEFTDDSELPAMGDRGVRSQFTANVNAYLLPKATIDKFGNPTQASRVRFTPKKLTIEEKIVSDVNNPDSEF